MQSHCEALQVEIDPHSGPKSLIPDFGTLFCRNSGRRWFVKVTTISRGKNPVSRSSLTTICISQFRESGNLPTPVSLGELISQFVAFRTFEFCAKSDSLERAAINGKNRS